MPLENVEIARLFREMADRLEIQGASTFRVRAYRSAARTIEEYQEPIRLIATGGVKQLAELPGIGRDLAGKILEILETGTFRALDELEVPRGLTDLLHIPGLGPKRVQTLYTHLGVTTPSHLLRLAQAGKVRELPGFGEQTERKIVDAIERHALAERRITRWVAQQYGNELLSFLRQIDGVDRAEIAGSYRRGQSTVGDLDVLVTCRRGSPVIEEFVHYPQVAEVIAQGRTRASVRLRSDLSIDIRVLDRDNFGAGLHYFTGSKAHNVAIRRMAQKKGLKINEYGVYRGKRRIAGATEEEVFAAVGLPWIPPELRENRGEIEAAGHDALPSLVTLSQIRGDLHVHTTASDGRDSLDDMVRAARAKGYEYVAVTDHSPRLRMVRGLDAAGFRRQMNEIDELNTRLERFTVLKGAEVDIDESGELDLDDRTAASLDIVVVAIHSKFDLSKTAQTRRILRAIRNPVVDILAHPTGRLIGRRDPIAWDLAEVCQAAAASGVILEINSQPERQDIDDLLCREAIDRGVMIAVNTDAHSCAEFDFMGLGVTQARRGWAGKQHIVNTRRLRDLRKLLHAARHSDSRSHTQHAAG